MIFNSTEFLVFFTVIFTVYFVLPSKFRWIFLLISSYLFYGYSNVINIFYLLIPTIIVWFLSLRVGLIKNKVKRKIVFTISIISSISFLLYFKYTDFFLKTLNSIGDFSGIQIKFTLPGLLIPMGISFFSFKLVSYSADVFLGKIKPEKHFGYFALYVSFFPQILMGPIERAGNFLPELRKTINFDIERIIKNLQLVAWGLFKKIVIADRLSVFVNDVFASPENQGINLLFGLYFYAIQIYCDFSGYSDIAIGIARILGFRSMENFNFPYFSRNIRDFWNRWHISLSTWLRDYLFLPIAYSTSRKLKKEKYIKIKSDYIMYGTGMFITMFIGGLWHGASWTFVIWGMLHGIFLIVGYSTKKVKKKVFKKLKIIRLKKIKDILSIFITFNLVSFAWIFFRSESFTKAIQYLKMINLKVQSSGIGHLKLNIIFVIVFLSIEYTLKKIDARNGDKSFPIGLRAVFLAFTICIILLLSVDSSNEFIYMRF